MKSAVPKVLHEICGRPMLGYILQNLRAIKITDILVVTNPELQECIGDFDVRGVVQNEQLGTGHAVRVALENLAPQRSGRILIAYADMPLVPAELFQKVIDTLEADNAVSLALVTARVALPSPFGRIIRRDGAVERIVEARDASADQLQIDEVNAGIYVFDESALREAVEKLRNANAQNEYYLTDTIEDLARAGKRVTPVESPDAVSVMGINDRAELAQVRAEMNRRLCDLYMRDGVTIIDPATTYLEPELKIGRDTVIYPNTSIGRLSEIGEHCVIGPNARLSNTRLGNEVTVRESVVLDSQIGDRSSVGPYAHIRNNAQLAENVRIGNFVEVKNSKLARGVKANHLAYIGDAEVGEDTNVGAGTITCNFDGTRKNKTVIGKNVLIGSNSSLIAPINIGDGALTGAGSVVTKDVAAGDRVAGNPAKSLPNKARSES